MDELNKDAGFTFKDPAMILFKDRSLRKVDSLITLDDVLFGHTTDNSVVELIESAKYYAKLLEVDGKEHLIFGKYKFSEDMRQARSTQSNAKYLLWHESKVHKHGFLVQYLTPHSETSYHHHNTQMEAFHVLNGTCWIRVDGDMLPFTAGSSLLIPPKISHQVITDVEPVINVIEIHNVDYKDHVEHEKKK